MVDLRGRVAVVTGGGRGLGFTISEYLCTAGATVALMGRDEPTLRRAAERLASAGNSTCFQGDVSSLADVKSVIEAVVDQTGGLDILVNNAGIADEAALLDITADGWNRVLATNLTGAFFMTQQAARKMRPGSAIVNVSSIDAYGADGPFASYVASKAGLIGLTKAAATELAPYGIRVNSVSPGWTQTQMVEESVSAAMLEKMRTDFQRVPIRRLLHAGEVAAVVAFLASPAANGITGADIIVDGGTLANLYILETLDDRSPSRVMT